MSLDDKREEPENWNPEDDKVGEKVQKTLLKYLERVMQDMDEMKKREAARAIPPPTIEDLRSQIGSRVVRAVADPFQTELGCVGRATLMKPTVFVRKIENGWIVQYNDDDEHVEEYATTGNLGEIVARAAKIIEENYEEDRKYLESQEAAPGRGALGG